MEKDSVKSISWILRHVVVVIDLLLWNREKEIIGIGYTKFLLSKTVAFQEGKVVW